MNSNRQSNNQKYFNPREVPYTVPKPSIISSGAELIRENHNHGEFVIMKGKGYKQIE